jgi:ketosteroid isomerase-like protein
MNVFSHAQTREKEIAEITDLRRKTVEAIEKRDRKTLDEIYAEDFSHTHATGKVDDKKTRLDTFVSGEKTIDTANAEDLKIKIFGKQTAVATGKSAIESDDGTIAVYRWTVVYAKIGKKWRIAASQATKFSE